MSNNTTTKPTDSELQLNDPVLVDVSSSAASGLTSPSSVSNSASGAQTPLHGVVAYLGPVHFVKSNADEWVGIRLTGSSVGLGKNDGSVKGVRYFPDCGPNGGIFVKRSSVTRRNLTKLEEVRLKRELSKPVSTSSALSDSNLRANRAIRLGDGDIQTPGRPNISTRVSAELNTPSRFTPGNSPLVSPNPKSKSSPDFAQINNAPSNLPSSSLKPNFTSPSLKPNFTSPSLKPNFTSPRSKSAPRSTNISSSGDSSPLQREIIPALNKTPSSSGTKFSPRSTDPKTSSLEKSVQTLNETLSAKENQIQFLQQRLRQVQEATLEVTQSREQLQLNLQKCQKELHGVKEDNRRLKVIADTYAKNQHLTESSTEDRNSSHPSPTKLQISLPTLRQELIQTQIQLNTLQGDYETVVSQKEMVEQQAAQTVREYQSLREQTSKERNQLVQEMKQMEMDLIQALGEKTALENKLHQRNEQMSDKESSQVEHYKEVVHLQTEISVLQRRLVEMEKEHMDKDVVIEELTLEKVQMEELIEILEDKVEELRIDAESADIERDEIRIELEEVRASTMQQGTAGPANLNTAGDVQNDPRSVSSDYDAKQALTIQNTRLREALTQLREQSVREKMDLQRQLRTAEKEVDATVSNREEFTKLKADHQRLRDEAEALKEMVDQGSNFEHMVEKLTDRIMILEEEKLNLESLVKDFEESIEISNAMEEAQLEEMKAMTKDLQFRDTLIINLEEGVKTMKRREQEYQRSIGNYRASMEKLQQEKNALLDLQKDGDGVKINYLAASQKALSYASRLVKEVTKSRKRDAEALNERIASQINSHLSDRFESFLPPTIATPEISSIKGEMFIVSTALKISLGLSLVDDICNTELAKGLDYVKTLNLTGKTSNERSVEHISLTESQMNTVQLAINHTKFMKLLIMSSHHIYRVLVAGQWPNLLSVEASMDLTSSAVSIISPLDSLISDHLQIFMQEGYLSTHLSNLSQLESCVDNVRFSLSNTLGDSGRRIIPDNWNPLCLEMYRDLSYSKLLCLCSASVLSALILSDDGEDTEQQEMTTAFVVKAIGQLGNLCSEATHINKMLAVLDVTYDGVIKDLFPLIRDWKTTCLVMSESFESVFSRRDVPLADLVKVESGINIMHKSITKVSAYVRALNLALDGGNVVHHLSPENKDPWRSITTEIGKLSDEEKLNYVKRARTLRKQLLAAVEKESKLAIAETKILQYEKVLATKSKEISMQNVRIEELEGIVSQVVTDNSVREAHSSTPTEEILQLTEENRMLSEAVRILQEQVEDFENDVMSQKGRGQQSKAPTKKGSPMEFPKNIDLSFDTATFDKDFLIDSTVSRLSLEAALFRPALVAASCASSVKNIKVLEEMMLKLPALEETAMRPPEEVEKIVSCSINLSLAHNQIRMLKSAIQLVPCPDQRSVTQGLKRTRRFIDDEKDKVSKAMRRLEESSSSAHHLIGLLEASTERYAPMPDQPPQPSIVQRSKMLGKVTISQCEGNIPRSVIPLSVRQDDLRKLHAGLLSML